MANQVILEVKNDLWMMIEILIKDIYKAIANKKNIALEFANSSTYYSNTNPTIKILIEQNTKWIVLLEKKDNINSNLRYQRKNCRAYKYC